MPTRRGSALIREWEHRFRKDPLAARVVVGLAQHGGEIWRRTVDLLQRESPEYRNSIDEEFARESREHCAELLRTIVAIAGHKLASHGDPFDFVRVHAVWRARHGVPLVASLHAYRVAHRTYWTMTRHVIEGEGGATEALRSLSMLSDFWIELFDHIGAELAEAHAVEDALTAARSTRSYMTLTASLLEGSTPKDPDAGRLMVLSGVCAGASMAVVVARADSETGLRSLVRLFDEAFSSARFGKLIDKGSAEVVAILSGDRNTPASAAEALRASGFARRMANGFHAGIGLEAREIRGLPRALEEARMAIAFADASRPLIQFSEIELPEFLIRRADPTALRLVPDWARRFVGGDNQAARDLTRTICAFADCSFNVKRTARRLGVHTNTIYFRLKRINEITGIDPRTFAGASQLLTAIRLVENEARYPI